VTVYEQVRHRFAALLVTLDASQLATRVPATPAWTVHDVVAHLVGLAADLNAQRFPADDDPGGSAWNDAQISSRRVAPLDELLAEWDREGPTFAAGLQLFGRETECHFVGDLVTHVLDVAEALAVPFDVGADAVHMALEHYDAFVHERLDALGVAMPGAVDALAPVDRLRLLSARRSLSSVPGAAVLADVYDGSGYAFPD
jgi:uncharacterized protein (TIGR03083 family)